MSMRAVCCVPVVAAGMIGATLALGADTGTRAQRWSASPTPIAPPGRQPLVLSHRPPDRTPVLVSQAMDGGSYARPGSRDPARNGKIAGGADRAAQQAAAQRVRPCGRGAPRDRRVDGRATAQRARPPLSESDQAALFLEFLRWKEQQKTAP